MGNTAEVLAREFHVTREEQDAYALLSHQRAVAAQLAGWMEAEIHPLPLPPSYGRMLIEDDGPRAGQSVEKLAKLRPYFDRHNGTVTVGNACPLTDGAAAVLVMRESRAKELGLPIMGYLRDYAYAGLQPQRMGLGPVFATAKLLARCGATMDDIDLIELNEAFAAQVIANERAFASAEFANRELGLDHALGEIDRDRMNVNGGAIALGHPVGMTGTRLVLTALKEMQRRRVGTALATMCIGGGQGGALFLEAA
ncbi:MAG: acetyl-CoA acyltransferase [Rhodothermales bacterium]|jgi:acetyl-CoA acyltransferase